MEKLLEKFNRGNQNPATSGTAERRLISIDVADNTLKLKPIGIGSGRPNTDA